MAADALPVTEAMRASLLERLRASHRLFDQVVADLTAEQANHVERPGVLPIAFSLAHAVVSHDRNVARLFGEPMLWDAHAARVRLEGGVPFRGTPMADAERVRIGDMDAWRAYQRAAFERTERLVAQAPLETLGRRVEVTPQQFAGGFLALLAGTPERVRVLEALEAWIYQHTIRHAGEIEHARALVGLGGVA